MESLDYVIWGAGDTILGWTSKSGNIGTKLFT
jgi:hypothetical protein